MKYEVRAQTNLSQDRCETRLTQDKACFTILQDGQADAFFSVSIELSGWDRENYVMMPACIYDGNRFKAVRRAYPPMFLEEEWGAMPETLLTEVPKLEREGLSKIEVTTGDLATPAVGLLSRKDGEAFLLFTAQGIGSRNFGIAFEELTDRAVLTLTYPAKRERGYRWGGLESGLDQPLAVNAGERIEIPFLLHSFPCTQVTELFGEFFQLRKCMQLDCQKGQVLPFSKAWEIQEDKFNRLNYRKNGGYYAVGTTDDKFQDWQVGWVGGGMSSLPLLQEGSAESRQRACSTLDYMFSLQSKAGLFYGIVHNGTIYRDGFDYPGTEQFHLIRKSADALYFAFKHFKLLQTRGLSLRETWITGARNCADAFVRMWEKYGQWGQFVEVETGEILVGNSTSAGIAAGALALAYSFFKEPVYLETAEKAAEYYYTRDVCRGVMTGGPGEILQGPDSESSFGMLESFIALYETTGDRKWLRYAEDAACQCASWCVSYNYTFPETSEFGRLGIKTTGSVFANVQNKHSAPGICTLSGNSLLKLFRATGKREYLELMSDIGGFIVQCMSTRERPVHSWDPEPETLQPGFICERVNMSDWEGWDKIGGVFNGSCWSEVSQMLTYAEIPGVYAVLDQKLLQVTDHVKAYFDDKGQLIVENPYDFNITVKVLAEQSSELGEILGSTYDDRLVRVELKPHESRLVG